MPELTPSADRYISAQLARMGQVPPEALDWVPEAERVAMLDEYCAAHPGAAAVRAEDGVLVAGQPSAPPTPAPTPAVPATAPTPAMPAVAPAPVPAAVAPAAVAAAPAAVVSPAFGAVAAQATPTSTFNPDTFDPRYFVGAGSEKALLDSKPAGRPVSRWLYLLPLFFGLVGGFIGWIITKDENPRGARNVLLVGVAVSAISLCFSLTMGTMASSALRDMTRMSGAYPGIGRGATVAWPATGATTGRPAMYYFGTST